MLAKKHVLQATSTVRGLIYNLQTMAARDLYKDGLGYSDWQSTPPEQMDKRDSDSTANSYDHLDHGTHCASSTTSIPRQRQPLSTVGTTPGGNFTAFHMPSTRR